MARMQLFLTAGLGLMASQCLAADLTSASGTALRARALAPPAYPSESDDLTSALETVRGAMEVRRNAWLQRSQAHQELLLCNAYPSKHAVEVRRNTNEVIVSEEHAVPFRSCRYVQGKVQQDDKLEFILGGSGIKGTFQVGQLPASDAVLLLVLEQHDSSSELVSFQSFAFPVAMSKGANAQLAVIDAFRGNASAPRLKVEDHIADREQQTVSKRVELLSFNRVYSVEEGAYDASVADHTREPEAESALERYTKKMLKLTKNKNYVVMRTGDDRGFDQGITVFPELQSHAQRRFTSSSLSLVLLASAAIFAF